MIDEDEVVAEDIHSINRILVITRRNYETLVKLGIELSQCLDSERVSDRFKCEIQTINKQVLSKLELGNNAYWKVLNLSDSEVEDISEITHKYLVEGFTDYMYDVLNTPLEKYYEITPLNNNFGARLIVVVEEAFITKVLESQENLGCFYSDLLKNMFSNELPSSNIQHVLKNYMRNKVSDSLLTKVKFTFLQA